MEEEWKRRRVPIMVWMLLIFFLPIRFTRAHRPLFGRQFSQETFTRHLTLLFQYDTATFILFSRIFFFFLFTSLIQPFRFPWIFRCRYCETFSSFLCLFAAFSLCLCVCVCLFGLFSFSILHSLCELSVLAKEKVCIQHFRFGPQKGEQQKIHAHTFYFAFYFLLYIYTRTYSYTNILHTILIRFMSILI